MTARRHFRTAPALLALAIAFAPPAQSAAQQPSGLLDMDTYMEMESVGSPSISPDGNYILFTRGSVDKMNDRNKSELMIMDLSTRRISELETGSFEVSSPIWSPDGTRIAFLSDKSGTNQIHVMWLDTRETKQLTNLDRAPGGIRWSPDGAHISFTSFIPDAGSPLPITMPAFPPGANLARPAVVEDRIAWQRDGTGYTRRGNTQIFIVDADLGGTPRQITFGDTSHGNPRWAPDGTKLYFSGDLIPEEGYERGNSEVHAIDLATLEITTLTDRLGPDNGPIPSPDGRMIAYTGYDENENYSNLSHLYLMDADGSGSRMLAGNLKNSPSGVTWAPDGSGLYYTLGEEGSSNLHFVSTSGDIEKVTDGVHYISGVSIAKNGRAAAINSTFYRPNYLVTFDLDDADELETLVDYNEDVLAGITLGEVEEIWTESVDGWPVQGWLMKPANFEPGREYPLLLWIHGGPVSMYTVRWNWNWQNFAADGYAVLWTNPRGSTGYGQDFVNGINYLYPGKRFPRSHGRRGRRHRPRLHRRGQHVRHREQRRGRPHRLDRGTHRPLPGRGVAAAGHQLALLRGDDGRVGLVPPLPLLSVGGPGGVRRAVTAALRRQRDHPDDAPLGRRGPAHPDAPGRGVLPRAQGARPGDDARQDSGRVPRLALRVAPDHDATLHQGVVRQVPDGGGDGGGWGVGSRASVPWRAAEFTTLHARRPHRRPPTGLPCHQWPAEPRVAVRPPRIRRRMH